MTNSRIARIAWIETMADAEVRMYLDRVKVVLDGATEMALKALALQISARAKVNIVENNQVDTGVMLNWVFTLSKEGPGGEMGGDGGVPRGRRGEAVERRKAVMPDLGD